MRWVYILECENNYFYVGETKRLFRRFWEHDGGKGGLNTTLHPPKNIVAIYKLSKMGKFFNYNYKVKNDEHDDTYNIYFNRGGIVKDFNLNDEDDTEFIYDNLWVENCILEKMMINNKDNWLNFRGGKYVKPDNNYSFPINNFVTELPMCFCNLPCDVNKNEDEDFLYFRCAKKNMWNDFKRTFNINDEPCSFFKKYNDDFYVKKYEKLKCIVFDLTKKSPWLENLVGCHFEYCIGGCGKNYDESYTLQYYEKPINLCFDCFITKNDELTLKYIHNIMNPDLHIVKTEEKKCLMALDEYLQLNGRGADVLIHDGLEVRKLENNVKVEVSKKQGIQLKRWFFTFNNYTLDNIRDLEMRFSEICQKYVFQEEKGQNGTPHLQGSIWLNKKMRFSEFNLPKTIHWEKMRNEDASTRYCSKDDTKNGKRWSKGFNDEDFLPLEVLNTLKYENLFQWQKFIVDLFKTPSTNRLVYWIYSTCGNVGKSMLCNYFYDNVDSVCFVDGVKKADIVNGIFNYNLMNPRGKKALGSKSVVLFDIPRNSGNKICYASIESIKNGLIFNTKFETGAVRFNSPHICIFANQPPVMDETLTADRWRIYEIKEDKSLEYKDMTKK